MLNASELDDSDDEWQDMPIEHVGPWSPSSANTISDSDSESDNERSPKSKRAAREAKKNKSPGMPVSYTHLTLPTTPYV